MSIFRTETDINTGEIVIINQFVYVNEVGNYVVLDDDETIPDGYELVEDIPQSAPIVPARVTMRQARLALHAAGLLVQVEAAIEALPEPNRTVARIEWDYASEVHRASEFVTLLGAALELDKQSLDDLFLKAREL